MIILAGFFVLTRLAIRFHNRRLGGDDWTIFASMVSDRRSSFRFELTFTGSLAR